MPLGVHAGDLRSAFRSLRRTPAATGLAILSVALGLGANTAIFSLLNALLLQPLSGVKAPYELLQLDSPALPSTILEGLRGDTAFTGACGFATPLLTTEDVQGMRPVGGLTLTGDCFATLGVHPQIGRLLTPSDDRESAPKVAVIGDNLWRDSFSRSVSALGATIRVAGVPFTIVGVTARPFRGLLLGFPPGVMTPAAQDPSSARTPGGFSWVHVFLRLAPGVSPAQAQARIAARTRTLLEQCVPPQYQGARREQFLSQRLVLTPADTGIDFSLRKRFGNPLKILMALCALVLLVSCVNLANLLFARGVRRRRELALRLALGARRLELVWQLTFESLLLVAAGAVAGCGFAFLACDLIVKGVSASMINFQFDAAPNLRALLLTFAVALLTGLVCGIVPAVRASELDPAGELKNNTRAIAAGARSGRLLIVAQVGLTLALVATTALFVSSLARLKAAPLGFRAEGVVEAQLFPLPHGYDHADLPSYYRDLLHRVSLLPGAVSVALSNFAPLFASGYTQPVGFTGGKNETRLRTEIFWTAHGFLRTLQIPLLSGRDFTSADNPAEVRTAIVSESLARRLNPNSDVVGSYIRVGDDPANQKILVVGVAADAKLSDPRGDKPLLAYLNYWQDAGVEEYPVLLVRQAPANPAFVTALRDEVRKAGHEYIEYAHTLEQQRENALLGERLLASLSVAFGALALSLAGVGLYGLLSFSVTNRSGEIGIRMALGADYRRVQWLILRDVLALVGCGIALGLPLVAAAGRAIQSLAYGVRVFDPTGVCVSILLLIAVAAIASWSPVRRACSVDPINALRSE